MIKYANCQGPLTDPQSKKCLWRLNATIASAFLTHGSGTHRRHETSTLICALQPVTLSSGTGQMPNSSHACLFPLDSKSQRAASHACPLVLPDTPWEGPRQTGRNPALTPSPQSQCCRRSQRKKKLSLRAILSQIPAAYLPHPLHGWSHLQL